MTSKRNKAILEEMLTKIDEELAEKEKTAARQNSAAEQILSRMGSTNIDDVFYAPKYEVPEGCPKIDLEVRTGSLHALYVILDCKKGIDDQKLKNAVTSLTSAKAQTTDRTKLCIYFINDSAHNRLAIERHRKLFANKTIETAYSSSMPDEKYK